MKPIAIVLLLIIVSCKTETSKVITAETSIDSSVIEMWNNFTESNPQYKNNDRPESWFFHNNKEDANRLAALVVAGKKKAGSGLYAWYEGANADLPPIGTKHIITNFDGKAQAIIEIRKSDTVPFNRISMEYASLDMGTNEQPLKKWREAHWNFFESALEESGQKPTKEMLVVCEYFEVIWPGQ